MKASIHFLKVRPEFFEDLAAGRKPFELRKDDRDYQVGDVLDLGEWTPEKGFGIRHTVHEVIFKLNGGEFGLEKGYCIMGLKFLWNSHREIQVGHGRPS